MTEAKTDYVVKTQPQVVEHPWRCEGCGSFLGYVMVNDKRIHELHVSVADKNRDHWPVMVGDGRVYCETCGKWREWFWGREAMEKLLRERQERNS